MASINCHDSGTALIKGNLMVDLTSFGHLPWLSYTQWADCKLSFVQGLFLAICQAINLNACYMKPF